MMTLAPRSSLLALLMLRGKPRLGSFFSSSSYPAAVPPPGNCTPAAPAVQPPAAPARPHRSSHKSPRNEESVLHPLPDRPKKKKAVIKKRAPFTLENRERRVPLPCAVDEDPRHPVPDYGSYSNSSTAEPVPGHGKPARENVNHPLPDPPKPHHKKGNAVLDKPSPATLKHPVPLLCKDPKHQTPDGGSYSSTAEPVPGSDKSEVKTNNFETVKDPLPDPPLRRPSPPSI